MNLEKPTNIVSVSSIVYVQELARFLGNAGAPSGVWLLTFASPFLYRLGHRYQSWIDWRAKARGQVLA